MTKKQHYIPQFYLKEFTSDNGSIYTYDIEKNIIGCKNSTRHLCSIDYFYEQNSTPDNIVENYLSEIENILSNWLVDILYRLSNTSNCSIRLTCKDIANLYLFISFQMFRTPSGLKCLEKIIKDYGNTDDMILISQDANLLFKNSKFLELAKLSLIDIGFGLALYMTDYLVIDSVNIFKGFDIWTSDVPITSYNKFESVGFSLSKDYYVLVHFSTSKITNIPTKAIIRSSDILYLQQDRNKLSVKAVKLIPSPYKVFNKASTIIIKSSKFTDCDIKYIKRIRGGQNDN